MSLLHRSRHRDDHGIIEDADTSTAILDELAHRPSTRKVPRRRSSGLKFFASSSTSKPQSASSSHKKWEADYLKDLRINRPARPGGSRPFPGRTAPLTAEPLARASSALSFRPSCSTQQADLSGFPNHERSASALSHRRAQSDMPVAEAALQQLSAGVASRDFSTSTISRAPRTTPNGTYRESGMRWMEKQEARSLREALEDMDLRDEAKVNAAAQDEASELVWKYRKQGMPQKSPDRLHSCKSHNDKGAHARSQSAGCHAEDDATIGEYATSRRAVSDTSISSKDGSSPTKTTRNRVITFAEPEKPSEERQPCQDIGHALWDSPQKKAYMSLNTRKLPGILGHRRSSGPRARDGSGGLFRNPGDKIYEEPDADKKSSEFVPSDQSRIPAPLVSRNRNTVSNDRIESKTFNSRVALAEDKIRLFRSEIHRNPPSQSRNPSYMENPLVSTPTGQVIANHADSQSNIPIIKEGKEIRGDDIRAATSMRMKDRSPKLPSPTVVSNRPGRPIVSFEQGWEPKDTTEDGSAIDRPSAIPGRLRFKPHMPASTASAPIVPTINVPNPPSIQVDEAPPINSTSVPSTSVSESGIPTISIFEDVPTTRPLSTSSSRCRPLPAKRPFPHHSSTTPVHSSKLHWTPASRRATAQCAACALPIEGRIVSAASQRFHPHCFTCHHCAEPLECVAFYPEPDSARTARVARIETRLTCNTHTLPDEKQGETAADDGDSSLRFYCHLDYHELYSPRCRSCKTPIESEVVLACGGSWHVGHFFCAECGDPFDANTPFVEKNGYAWCVGCHAGRFSGKCKGCRKPVVEGGVSALGSEWHVECFCCVQCGGQFEDGRFFTSEGEEKPNAILESSEYSDLTICCGSEEFKVHRAIVCPRSKFFATACGGQFKEAKTSTIVLEEDDPPTVRRMLTYFYTLAYDDEGDAASAQHYMVDETKMVISQDLTDSSTPLSAEEVLRHVKMMNNVVVCAIAEKYDMNELKGLATAKFRELLWLEQPCYALPHVIDAVYETTFAEDLELRNVVVEFFTHYSTEILADRRLGSIIKDHGELGLNVLREVTKNRQQKELLHRKLLTLKRDLAQMIKEASAIETPTKCRSSQVYYDAEDLVVVLLQKLKTAHDSVVVQD